MSKDRCETTCINATAVKEIEAQIQNLSGLADLFKALGDETRVKLLYALSIRELCVCDLSEILETSQSNTSHHLRYLRAARLVKSRKQGRQVFYSLDDEHVEAIISMGIEHVKHI